MIRCVACNEFTTDHSIAQMHDCLRKLTNLKLATGVGESRQCAFCSFWTTKTVGGRPHCGRTHGRKTPLKFTPRPFEGRRG